MREKNQYVADTLYKYFYNEPAILPIRENEIRRPKAIVVNETDTDTERSGSWSITDTPDGFSGKSLRAQPNSGAEISYFAQVPYNAHYFVYAWVPFNSGGTADATFKAHGSTEEKQATFNHRILTNRGWKLIGSVYLERGFRKIASVSSDGITDNRPVFADAVMLVLDRKQSPDVDIPVLTTNLETEHESEIPAQTELMQNYPNPFNPTTTISFRLHTSQRVELAVYNLLGQQVSLLIGNEIKQAGSHSIQFNASNLASGVYVYQLKTENSVFTKTLTLIK